MDVANRIRALCTPALVFFVISVISLLLMIFDNIENTHSYCFGNVSCNVANTSMVFIVKIVFIVVWTWFLDILCSRGYERVSWFIVLLPYIFMFMILVFVASEIRNTSKLNEASVAIQLQSNNDAFGGMMRF
jgi:hypothetical protein